MIAPCPGCGEPRGERYPWPGQDPVCWPCHRKRLGGDGSIPEPSPSERFDVEPVPTGQLIERVERLIRRFVVLPSDASYLALALFVLHTWAFDAAHATPYFVVESPEKQSGKTRLLEVLALVSHYPVKVASITAAALFQTVSQGHPTLLIDEADAIFAGNGERNEDLRGVMNAGNAPGSPVIRGGKNGQPVSYNVFCPKVIAGIATGRLPDTIRDRAVVIAIDRKLRSERVERLRLRREKADVDRLREDLGKWAKEHQGELDVYYLPDVLEKLSDRLEEAWEPLLAIAELAGGDYPERARHAAEELAGRGDEDATHSHTLLLALKEVFGDREAMFTRDMLTALNADDELPFGAWNDGAGLKPVGLGRLLKRYRIRPATLRIGTEKLKGYERNQFTSVWERYGGVSPVAPVASQCSSGNPGDSDPWQDGGCHGSENSANARPIRDATDATAQMYQERAERLFAEYGMTMGDA